MSTDPIDLKDWESRFILSGRTEMLVRSSFDRGLGEYWVREPWAVDSKYKMTRPEYILERERVFYRADNRAKGRMYWRTSESLPERFSRYSVRISKISMFNHLFFNERWCYALGWRPSECSSDKFINKWIDIDISSKYVSIMQVEIIV